MRQFSIKKGENQINETGYVGKGADEYVAGIMKKIYATAPEEMPKMLLVSLTAIQQSRTPRKGKLTKTE